MKVLAYLSAFVLYVPLASAETILLDFSGNHCPPCRQMEPVVAALEREGYRVERVNVELSESKAKVDKFRVKEIPTFVALTDGRETDRIVGAVSIDRLRLLLGSSAQARSAKPAAPPANTSKPVDVSPTKLTQGDRPSDQTLIERSVRIMVDDAKSRSFGTGTVVRSVPGEALILTCAHLFQGVSRQAKTTVEFFGRTDRPKLAGEVLARDTEGDVCLVRVVYPQVIPTARVAGGKSNPATGQATASVGCDNGSDPTVRHMRVTAINRYVGAPTIECSSEPVEGRSGGGLFNELGEVIGVCSARDPADHRGIYGGLSAIHALLDRNNLASLYETKPAAESGIVLAGHESKAASPVTLPSPTAMGLKVDHDLPMPDGAERAEVVCVIRSLEDPSAPAKVVLLNRASPEFLSLLEKEQAAQSSRPNTSMRMPARPDRQPIGDNPAKAPALSGTESDRSGWRSATGDGKAAPDNGALSAVQESASWQKNWPAGAGSLDGPIRR